MDFPPTAPDPALFISYLKLHSLYCGLLLKHLRNSYCILLSCQDLDEKIVISLVSALQVMKESQEVIS